MIVYVVFWRNKSVNFILRIKSKTWCLLLTDTRWTTTESWFVYWQEQEKFLFSRLSRPTLGPTVPYYKWVPWALLSGVGRWCVELTTHSASPITKVKNEWIYTTTSTCSFTECTQKALSLSNKNSTILWKVKCSLLFSQKLLKHLNAAPPVTQIFNYKMFLPHILYFTSAVIHEVLGVNFIACFPLPEYSTRFANLNFFYFIAIITLGRNNFLWQKN